MKRTTLLQRCRKEFDCSFREYVTGCAEMGYSLTLTATALGTYRKELVRNLKRFGLRHLFMRPQREMVKSCRPGGRGRVRVP